MTESAWQIQITPLGENRGDEAASLVARAFQDDPLFVYGCPDPRQRARWLPWLFRWSAWKGLLFGQLLGTVGRLDGVAAVVAPSAGDFSEEQLARFGYARGRDAVSPAVWDQAVARINAAFAPADAALHDTVPEPHWYLDALAVDPARQGQGIGSRLLRAVHERADAAGLPTVLLTFQPTNLPFYERHGHAVVCQGRGPASGPEWWGLRREPGA